ncbi:unnamed protein product [Parnassius mnemosyne]|uniref:DDE-1 domain-containing protein n=1 Tax=Parnassius mnemosyne TaxID=213953 RepID=A0AAV1LQJ9_9NEOP
MVRTYKPKTERCNINEENMKAAISDVISKKLSIRVAAGKYNVKTATLQHRIEKFRKSFEDSQASSSKSYSSKYTVAQVFSKQEEKMLTEYLLNCSKMHYGLSLQQLLVLAYEFAEYSGCKYPESWKKNKCAGKDWSRGFRMRNQELSLRKPENTSAARSFAFNRTAVNDFFDNYELVMLRYKFAPDRIINLDETGVTTVLSTPKVLAEKTQRQVGQMVSAERGELVTFCGIVTATGVALPPVYVFPRVHFKDHFLNGAPVGSLGLSNRSGWMTAELHVEVLKHIQRHTSCTKDNPILIICDNHESHVSIQAVNFCRDHGIVYLSLPPHTSHKLQPLDVSVFGPFKSKLKIAFNDWHIRNVGKTLSIYNIAELTKSAFLESFTPRNITSGFSKPGIWPFNRLAFGDDDFAPIEVFGARSQNEGDGGGLDLERLEVDFVGIETSQERVNENCAGDEILGSEADPLNHQSDIAAPPNLASSSSSVTSSPNVFPSTSETVLSPEAVRPYPKIVTNKKTSIKGREKGKSRIYTETPEKNRLEILQDKKERMRQLKMMKEKAKALKTAKNLLGLTETKKSRKKRVCLQSQSDSESSQNESIKLCDDYDNDLDELLDEETKEYSYAPDPENINIGDFLLIKFDKKKSTVYYVAKVLSKYNLTEYQVSYLRKKPGSCVFVFPNVEDLASVDFRDVVLQLPEPNFTKGTCRTSSHYTFSVNLSAYKVQ